MDFQFLKKSLSLTKSDTNNIVKITPIIGLVFIFNLIMPHWVASQTALPTIDLNNFKWGLKDSITAEVMVRAQYDYITPFRNGIAITKLDNYYGIIDQSGKVLAEPIYFIYYWYSDDLLMLREGNLYGLVNSDLEEIMPFEFHSLHVFGDYLVVNNGEKSGIIDLDGNIIIPFEYDEILIEYEKSMKSYLDPDRIRVVVDGKCGMIDYQNNIVIPIEYQYVVFSTDNRVFIFDHDKLGLADRNGNFILPIDKYDHFDSFEGGMIAAGISGHSGYIDSNENVIIPFEYDYSRAFQYGLGCVEKNELWGAINKNNEVVIPIIYTNPIVFHNGVARLELEENDTSKFAYINSKAAKITDFIYDEAPHFKDNIAKVRIGDKWGLLDTNGVEIIPVQYDHIIVKRGYAIVHNERIQGLYNLKGDVILPTEYSYIYPPINDRFIMVRMGRKYGYVNQLGEIVIPLIYDNARNFSRDRATVLLSGESFEINRAGNRIGGTN